jgi:TolB-like protein
VAKPVPAASVAVIPFVNARSTPEGIALAEGISEGLISALAQLPDLRVIARSSSFRFSGDTRDVRRIARALGVRTVVTGRITEEAGRLRVTTELVNGENRTTLWGAEYTRDRADLADIQGQIATEIARRVRSKLTSADQRRLAKLIHPNPEVYSLLLRGRYQMSLYTPESTQRAASYFEQALGIDQSYAMANAELANAYRRDWAAPDSRPREALPLAEQAALKAIAADAELGTRHTVLADIRRDRWTGAPRTGALPRDRAQRQLRPRASGPRDQPPSLGPGATRRSRSSRASAISIPSASSAIDTAAVLQRPPL